MSLVLEVSRTGMVFLVLVPFCCLLWTQTMARYLSVASFVIYPPFMSLTHTTSSLSPDCPSDAHSTVYKFDQVGATTVFTQPPFLSLFRKVRSYRMPPLPLKIQSRSQGQWGICKNRSCGTCKPIQY